MNLIVATDRNFGIGKDGDLLYHIPEDMKYFRAMTSGKTVIMGHRTLLSLPGGNPLKNRRNIVFSRNENLQIDGAEVVHSVNELTEALCCGEEAFVIGGEALYRLLLDYCEKAYITMINARAEADRFFPDIDSMENWVLASESELKEHEGVTFTFRVYENQSVKETAACSAADA